MFGLAEGKGTITGDLVVWPEQPCGQWCHAATGGQLMREQFDELWLSHIKSETSELSVRHPVRV